MSAPFAFQRNTRVRKSLSGHEGPLPGLVIRGRSPARVPDRVIRSLSLQLRLMAGAQEIVAIRTDAIIETRFQFRETGGKDTFILRESAQGTPVGDVPVVNRA